MKSDAGFATVAGVELTLLDCVRYFHKAAGINGVAQIVKDIGAKASPRLLQKAAGAYENSAVRRLGYLLELAGHARQADALQAVRETRQDDAAPRSGRQAARGGTGAGWRAKRQGGSS